MRHSMFTAAATAALLTVGTVTAAVADPPPTVVVSLGDSYISGEAGRWLGNSSNNDDSRNGTDRAWTGSGYATSQVYLQGTHNGGCHRADVADVHHSGAVTTINLACSGAVTANVWRASQGGQSQNGWAPQADQLAALDPSLDIDAIVLSVGGNDLGFSDIILECASDWATSTWWNRKKCANSEQANVDARMPGAMADLGKAIDEIDAVMALRGDSDYRFVVRSYPSPIPRGNENRYSETGWSRWNSGGCPFWNSDSNWARDSLVPQISAEIASVAAGRGVEFLDLQDLLEDREVCSVHASHVDSDEPDGAGDEWVRWMNTGWNQGHAQESLHPNAHGQTAAGTCMAVMLTSPVGDYDCTNVLGAGPTTVSLTGS